MKNFIILCITVTATLFMSGVASAGPNCQAGKGKFNNACVEHPTDKSVEDFKLMLQGKVKDFIKVTDNSGINLLAGKDVYKQKASDGWFAGLEYELQFTAFDFSK